jgi:hypothetical protein
MRKNPVVGKLLCIAAVAAVVAPIGWMLLPHLDQGVSAFEFSAIEAIASTMIGFGLYAALFG